MVKGADSSHRQRVWPVLVTTAAITLAAACGDDTSSPPGPDDTTAGSSTSLATDSSTVPPTRASSSPTSVEGDVTVTPRTACVAPGAVLDVRYTNNSPDTLGYGYGTSLLDRVSGEQVGVVEIHGLLQGRSEPCLR